MISVKEEIKPLSVSGLKRLIQARAREVAREHARTINVVEGELRDETFYSAWESGKEIDAALGDLRSEPVPLRLDKYQGEIPVFNPRVVFFNAYKAELYKLRNPRRLTYLCRNCGDALRPYTNRDFRIEYYGRSESNYFCSLGCGYSWAVTTIQVGEEIGKLQGQGAGAGAGGRGVDP